MRGFLVAVATAATIACVIALGIQGAGTLHAGANKWTNANLDTMDTIGLVSSPDFENDGILLATDPLEDTVWRTEDFAMTWMRVSPRSVEDPRPLAISPNFGSDKTVFLGDANAVYMSTSYGASWVDKTRRFGVKEVQALAVSPDYSKDHTVFAGTAKGVYVSRDAADTWEFVGPEQLGESNRNVLSIALSPNYSSDRTVFIGLDRSGLYKSTDGGANWSQGWLSIRQIEAVAFSPEYARDRTAFAGNPHDGLYRTTNGAMSQWKKIAERKVHSILVSPRFGSDQTIYLGKSDGVRFTTNGGADWNDSDGEFREKVNAIVLASPRQNRLFAGTFDKGVYEYTVSLPTATPTITSTATATLTPTPKVTETSTVTPTESPTVTPETPQQEPQVYLPALLNKEEFDGDEGE